MAFAVVVYVRAMITVLLGGSSYQLNTQISFSSVDYTVDEEVESGGGTGGGGDSTPWPQPDSEPTPWPQTEAETEAAPWPQADEPPSTEPQAWTADFHTTQSGPQSTTSLEQEFG